MELGALAHHASVKYGQSSSLIHYHFRDRNNIHENLCGTDKEARSTTVILSVLIKLLYGTPIFYKINKDRNTFQTHKRPGKQPDLAVVAVVKALSLFAIYSNSFNAGG